MKLQIFLITYNRADYLKKTLEFLCSSALNKYQINILDNCSTDNSIEVANQFKNLLNLKISSNAFNIGGDANILRAIELSKGDYTWILCDDDIIKVDDFTDVEQVIEKGEIDMIHVGAHPDENWNKFGGRTEGIKVLWDENYPFFKHSSFLPCNIFKTKIFQKNYLINGYENINFHYPHLAYAIDQYIKNSKIYISKKQLIFAQIGAQDYSHQNWFYWWMRASEQLQDKIAIRKMYLDQWKSIGNHSDYIGLFSLNYIDGLTKSNQVKRFIYDYLTFKDKLTLFRIKYNTQRIKNLGNKIGSKFKTKKA